MQKYKVFVCDDDEGIVDVTRIILEEQGYDVSTMSDGSELLERIEVEKPDLVLVDLWMPNVPGETVVKTLKGSPETKNIPVIIFSASKDTTKVAGSVGADDYICKPFDLTEIEQKVSALLKQHS